MIWALHTSNSSLIFPSSTSGQFLALPASSFLNFSLNILSNYWFVWLLNTDFNSRTHDSKIVFSLFVKKSNVSWVESPKPYLRIGAMLPLWLSNSELYESIKLRASVGLIFAMALWIKSFMPYSYCFCEVDASLSSNFCLQFSISVIKWDFKSSLWDKTLLSQPDSGINMVSALRLKLAVFVSSRLLRRALRLEQT